MQTSTAASVSQLASSKRKTFVLDTNVLLNDVGSLKAFGDNDVVLPLVVLEELDQCKKRPDEVGRNARAVCRELDALRSVGSLRDGVKLGAKLGTLSVVPRGSMASLLPAELDFGKNDNIIIAVAASLKEQGKEPTVVSTDINVRVKCDAIGLTAQDYFRRRAADQACDLYTGVSVKRVSDELLAKIYEDGEVPYELVDQTALPNQIVVVPRGTRENATTVRRVGSAFRLVEDHRNVFGLTPRNKEQNFALDLLLDDDVKLVTLTGPAGCGKTLLALAAGLHKVLGTSPKYDKLVVTRPIEPLGRDIGYLPGSIAEKMEPWIAPIKDNLEFLMSNTGKKDGDKKKTQREFKRDPYIDLLFEKGKIEVEAVTYIRGRSIPNAFMIIDEAQNVTPHQLKTIITRSGENTKVVLCGDIEQIDSPHMDATSNGLSYVVERFKDLDIAGHVTLLKGVRSALASTAAERL